MINATQIVHEFLTQGGNPLSSAVGYRVWSPIAHGRWKNTTKAIVFHEESGDAHISGATLRSTFVFKCFGGSNSYQEAHDLYGLLYDRLQSASATLFSGTITRAGLVTHSQLPPEAKTQFKSIMAKFSIQFEG